jgi:hypothetical protein
LLKRWQPVLESGKTIESTSTKVALAQILENTRNFYKAAGVLNEGVTQAQIVGSDGSGFGPDGVKGKGVMTGQYSVPYTTGSMDGYGDYYLPNVVIPMLRRIMPDLMANELVAVQPLNGPIGFALAYRPTYNNNGIVGEGNLSVDREIGYAPTDTRYTGVSAENKLTADDITGYWDSYAGVDNGAWLGEGAPLGEKSEYADLNKGTYPTVSFGLVKSAVEAKTRKLAAHWSPELAEDMQAMHGIDVEREMVNTLTYEIGAEIDRQVLTEMVKAAIIGKSTSQWSPVTADGLDQMGRLATLLTQITVEANQIAIRTRRGNANFVVTTPRVCALLQQLSMNKFTSFKTSASMPTVPDTGVGALAKIGLINDDQQLLVRDSYASVGKSDYVLMGYKGKQPGDSGIIYCPYVPLQLSKVMQPGSFTPSVGARTRYGLMSNPWDAKNYYHFMKVTGLTDTYVWNGNRQFITTPSTIPLKTQAGNVYAQTVNNQDGYIPAGN